MDKKAIENKDRDTLRKIDKIRQENAATRKRRRLKNILAIPSLVIAFSLIGLFIVSTNIKGTSPVSVTQDKETRNQSDNSLASYRNMDAREAISDRKKTNPRVRKAPVRAEKEYGEIYVARSVVCKEIKARSPTGEQHIFSVKENPFSVVWTEVKSKVFPTQVTHIYYLNGEKYCEVPLLVKYPRMRTWSKIALRHGNQIGSWKVDVVAEDGTILKEIGFEVTS